MFSYIASYFVANPVDQEVEAEEVNNKVDNNVTILEDTEDKSDWVLIQKEDQEIVVQKDEEEEQQDDEDNLMQLENLLIERAQYPVDNCGQVDNDLNDMDKDDDIVIQRQDENGLEKRPIRKLNLEKRLLIKPDHPRRELLKSSRPQSQTHRRSCKQNYGVKACVNNNRAGHFQRTQNNNKTISNKTH